MRTKLAIVLLGSSLAACATPQEHPGARALETVNQPVMSRATFVYDLNAPAGVLAPQEVARLDGWFRGLSLGYGDSIYVDGGYADAVRAQVSEVAANYGMLVLPAAPVSAGAISPGSVRVLVNRTRAEVPGCPNWSVPNSPNWTNTSLSNLGCAINTNYALMIANPEDLFYGREGSGVGNAATAAKAVEFYRKAPPSAGKGLQSVSSKGN